MESAYFRTVPLDHTKTFKYVDVGLQQATPSDRASSRAFQNRSQKFLKFSDEVFMASGKSTGFP